MSVAMKKDSHITPEIIFDAYCTIGTRRETACVPETLLRTMDEIGVAAAVIHPEDHEIAWANAAGNDRILTASLEYPSRLIPACSVAPWSGDEGIHELRRVAQAGAHLLTLAPMLQGFLPNDTLIDPLVAEAGRLDLPVYIHTGTHTGGCLAQCLFLAMRHASTRFILGHAGTSDHSYDLRVVAEQRPENLWIETSFVRPWALPNLLELFGEGRLIFGTGHPRNLMAFERCSADAVLPVRLHPDIYRNNLCSVLKLGATFSSEVASK